MEEETVPTGLGFASPDVFFELTEHAPALLWISDGCGRCLHLNKRLREFWGIEDKSLAEFDWSSTMHPDDAVRIYEIVQAALSRQTGFVATARYRKANCGFRLLRTEASPRFSPEGRFIGMIGVNTDITETEDTLIALKDGEERLRIATRAAGLGVFEWDILNDIAALQNDRMKEILGHNTHETSLSKTGFISSYIHTEDVAAFEEALSTSLLDQSPIRSTCRIHRRADGALRWIEIAGNFVADREGRVIKLVGVVSDITERQLADEHARVLLGEVTHRSKNLLAVTQSIIRQTARTKDVPSFVDGLLARLQGLATSHDLLIAGDWHSADLETLIRAQLSHVSDLSDDRISLLGPPVRLRPAAAQAIGMAFHELATNATKYGSLSCSGGSVKVHWHLNPDAHIMMTWAEAGGPTVSPPQRQGFGQFVIKRSLEHALEARVSMNFNPTGFVWTLVAPSKSLVGPSVTTNIGSG